jgi:hypothetical protein
MGKLQSLIASNAKYELGAFTEELMRKTVLKGEDYLLLASKIKGNQGIDLVFINRKAFEAMYGGVEDVSAASRILSHATDDEIRRLAHTLKQDDLVSIEVKFRRYGLSPEEVLSAGRGGIQQNRKWYRSLLPEMLSSADTEVQATGRLLQRVIGSEADQLGRLSRIGISLNRNGIYIITRLTDDMIEYATLSRGIWSSRQYHGLGNALRAAEMSGNTKRATTLRNLLLIRNRLIDFLDDAVRNIKYTQSTSILQAQNGLQKTAQQLAEINAVLHAPSTSANILLLHTANSLARTYLEYADSKIDESEVTIKRAKKVNEDDKAVRVKMDELNRRLEQTDVTDAELVRFLSDLRDKYPRIFDE